jgi:hypothetical protein
VSPPPAASPKSSGAAGALWLKLSQRWPGALLCTVIALAASFVAGLHHGPQLLHALLFGIGFNFLSSEAQTRGRASTFAAPACCASAWRCSACASP